MEDVRPLTPVKAEEDDARIMSGADKTELTPALEASSSALLDTRDVNPLTLVAGSEDDRKLVMQTQLGETMVKLICHLWFLMKIQRRKLLVVMFLILP